MNSFKPRLILISMGLSTLASFSLPVQATIIAPAPEALRYCETQSDSSNEWIDHITVDGFSAVQKQQVNQHAQNGYRDFTNQALTLSKGEVTLSPGFLNEAYREHWAIWIDANQDGLFSANEKVLADLTGNGSVTANLNLPQVSHDTTTRMRVTMKYNSTPESACGDLGSGAVSDYTVVLKAPNNPKGITASAPISINNGISTGISNGISNGTPLPDTCSLEGPFRGNQLSDGDPVCIADSGINYFSFPGANAFGSVAVSTGHGSGDLSLYAMNGRWPATNGSDPGSTNTGNKECIILSNPSHYWSYIAVTGNKSGASLVVDYGATSCRTGGDSSDPTDPTDPPGSGNDGYPYTSVNVLVYRFEFIDAAFPWNNIEQDMQAVRTYFQEQSYGNFNVTWNLSQPIIRINEPKSNYDNNFFKWRDLYEAKIRETGVDPNNPGGNNIIMVTAPQVGNFNSSAAPPSMSIYHHNPGTVAHEIGHAVGLRHSKALEAGPGRIIGVGNYETESLNYGNVYAMMGMGAGSLEEFNLLYKSFFPNWLAPGDVPLATTSGTYRIYAFDHGTSAGTNAPGAIGLRLKSGNDLYTYWLEYRTTNTRYPNTKNGVLINLEGYFEANETDARFWKTTSYLLDMTPGSKTPGWWGDDQTDSELVIGQSYTDHWGGFRITVVGKGGTENTASAWIDVRVEML